MKIECSKIGGNMLLVEALDTYKVNGIPDNNLGRIPEPGETFEVSEERLQVLLGNNPYKKAFVKLVDQKIEEEPKVEKKKRTIKKKITK